MSKASEFLKILEGNPVSDKLPAGLDSMLQNFAQMVPDANFDYKDIASFKPTDDQLKRLKIISKDLYKVGEDSPKWKKYALEISKMMGK